MAGFEDLIRSALKKQGDPTPERRAAIYQSSRQALERMLGQNTTLGETAIALQRQRLETAIKDIEEGYSAAGTPPVNPTAASVPPTVPPVASPTPPPPSQIPAPAPMPAAPQTRPVSQATPVVPSPVQQAPAPQPRAAQPRAPEPQAAPQPTPAPEIKSAERTVRVEPGFEAPKVPTPPAPPQNTAPLPDKIEPDAGIDHQPVRLEDYPESYKGTALKERKPYAKLLLWTIILVGIAVAVWWAISFGPAYVKEKLGGSVPNPSQTIESGSFLPENRDGWVTAFNPAEDAANIDSADRGQADLFQDGNRNFIRLASNAGSTRNNLRIQIPRGVMEPLQGKAVTFEVVLKNPADQPHQFALFCEFGEMGSCGRKRFQATNKVEAFIFDVLINDAPLGANENAYLSINTDLTSNGKPVDIFGIRIRSDN